MLAGLCHHECYAELLKWHAACLAALDWMFNKVEESHSEACAVCAGNGSQWSGMGAELLDSSPVFRAAIDDCAAVLEPLGVHLHEEFRAADGWKRPKHAMVGLTALQVGLVDVLREEHGITPAGCLGHSSGEHRPLAQSPECSKDSPYYCCWGLRALQHGSRRLLGTRLQA